MARPAEASTAETTLDFITFFGNGSL